VREMRGLDLVKVLMGTSSFFCSVILKKDEISVMNKKENKYDRKPSLYGSMRTSTSIAIQQSREREEKERGSRRGIRI
jgi:hypothetical protein